MTVVISLRFGRLRPAETGPGKDTEMDFGEAIRTCWSKSTDFTGRAPRPEYWYWFLFNFVATLMFGFIQYVVSDIGGEILQLLFDLAVLLPSIAVTARRLHDTDRSGWWQLLFLVPLIGWVVLIVWLSQRGTPGPNRFGPASA
jgi:uncharacterized membrane protein YhaH (DUF805 family)